jgi:NADH-quinone oxidoreductase subunit N
MWVPDVYQGAPTAVTLMIGGAPKLAAFAIVIRLLVEGMLPLWFDWQQMLMRAGHRLAAGGQPGGHRMQTNLKRMLAFSTIAQMGFVLLGLISGVVNGNINSVANAYSAAMFYVVTYVLTTLATFGVILLLAREGFESEEISDSPASTSAARCMPPSWASACSRWRAFRPWSASTPSSRCCRR